MHTPNLDFFHVTKDKKRIGKIKIFLASSKELKADREQFEIGERKSAWHRDAIQTADIENRAIDLFTSGYYCAESVLLAIAEEHGIESDLIPALATGFCNCWCLRCGRC